MSRQTAEEALAVRRAHRERNKERINARHRAYMRKRYRENAEYREKLAARNLAVPLLARNARSKVFRAIKRGQLVRPDVCSACEREAFCEAAHEDYGRPLDVTWLCRSCHRRWDRAAPKVKVA